MYRFIPVTLPNKTSDNIPAYTPFTTFPICKSRVFKKSIIYPEDPLPRSIIPIDLPTTPVEPPCEHLIKTSEL